MKLNISVEDAESFILKRFKGATAVAIRDVPVTPLTPVAPHLVQSFILCDLVKSVRRFDYMGDEKIAAIKAVREYGSRNGVSIGLADAKFFVENI